MSIKLYTWGTPNGKKASIMLEEVGLPYSVHPIDITNDDQFAPDFLAVSPNNKIPAIVDEETGLRLMESGAILLYLAQKTGKLLPEGEARWKAIEWLMWQMGGFGPMLGQAHHFARFNPGKAPYAEERYLKETARLYGVLDKRLAENEYLAGDSYSVADVAAWPWAARFEWHGIDMNALTNVRRWYTKIAAREAVVRGYNVPKEQSIPMP